MAPTPLSRPPIGSSSHSRLAGGLALSALLLAACSEDKDPLDSVSGAVSVGPTSAPSGGPSGDPSGDPTEGGTGGVTEGATEGATEGSTTGSSGHGDCDQFLLCLGAVDPSYLREAQMLYGPEGSCWTMPDLTQQCLDACASGLASYGSTYPDEPACGGGDTSTSDPWTSTTDPWTSTTDPWTSTTDPWTSTTEPDTTTGAPYGNCGWDPTNQYYACGFTGEGTTPIDCPPVLPAPGEPCDENSAIDGIGCCLPNGDNYYCAGEIVVESCGG